MNRESTTASKINQKHTQLTHKKAGRPTQAARLCRGNGPGRDST